MATTPPQTHKAVATPATRAKLILLDRATEPPEQGEILVRVAWASSTPLNLHQADGGLLVTHPYILSSDYGGEVVAVGGADDNDPELHGIKVGDTVFGFAWRKDRERTHQEYVTVPAFLASRLPPNLTLQEAVTVPTNLVTAFHVLTKDLQLELPWPLPDGWTPPSADAPVLIWGAAGSVGTYCVQVLRHWRYRHILAVASGRHHAYLKEAGATACFDYGDPDVTARILEHVGPAPDGTGPRVPFVVDAIGSLDGTLAPLTRVAERGTRVAVMLPVIVRDAAEDVEPVYEMDVGKTHPGRWAEGTILLGTRTHFYLDNEFFKDHLQSEIVPSLLAEGVIKPNRRRVVEGATLLERAQNALDLLRRRDVSGEKLVWRVSDP